jgi:phosphoribosyl-dephospho-CoA transferase
MSGFWFASDQEVLERLKRIESKLDRLLASGQRLEESAMSEKEELERLKATVASNRDVVASATAALTGYVKSNAELQQQLAQAITEDNTDAIKEASDAIAANNDALMAAIPAVAQAVKQNTPAA